LWRIPEGINVAPLPPPTRTVTGADIGLLNARRGQPGESQSAREYSRFGSAASRILVLIAWQA
jgi:hypothetical protein